MKSGQNIVLGSILLIHKCDINFTGHEMSQEDPRVQARIKEILARRAALGTGTSAVLSKPSGVEAAKPSTDPRVQEILAQRTMVDAGKSAAMGKPSGVEAAKHSTEPRAITQVDLKSIENHMMFSIAALGQANNSLDKLGKEIHMLTTFFKVVLGVGVVGVILCVAGILRLTGHFFN